MDVDLVKSDIRDLVERISSTMKERDEGLHQVVTLKRQNDDLLEHTVQLEDQVVTLKVFSFKTFYFLLFFVIFTGDISKETI